MGTTPGFILPSSFPNKEALKKKLQEQSKNAGFTPLGGEFQKPSLDELSKPNVKERR